MLLENQIALVHTEDSKQVLVGRLSKAWNLKGKLDDHLLGWNFFDIPHRLPLTRMHNVPATNTPVLRFSGFMKNPANLLSVGCEIITQSFIGEASPRLSSLVSHSSRGGRRDVADESCEWTGAFPSFAPRWVNIATRQRLDAFRQGDAVRTTWSGNGNGGGEERGFWKWWTWSLMLIIDDETEDLLRCLHQYNHLWGSQWMAPKRENILW